MSDRMPKHRKTIQTLPKQHHYYLCHSIPLFQFASNERVFSKLPSTSHRQAHRDDLKLHHRSQREVQILTPPSALATPVPQEHMQSILRDTTPLSRSEEETAKRETGLLQVFALRSLCSQRLAAAAALPASICSVRVRVPAQQCRPPLWNGTGSLWIAVGC